MLFSTLNLKPKLFLDSFSTNRYLKNLSLFPYQNIKNNIKKRTFLARFASWPRGYWSTGFGLPIPDEGELLLELYHEDEEFHNLGDF